MRVDLQALRPQARRDAAEEVAFGLHLLLHQHLDQCSRIHRDLVHLAVIDARRFHERGPQLEIPAADVKGNGLAFEILRLGDAVFLEREDADRGARPNAGNRNQVEPASRAVHHDREVENAEIVLALIDRHAHLAGAEATIDGDVEAALLPESHLLGHERVAERAERQPWQRHLHRRCGAHDRRRSDTKRAACAGRSGQHQKGTAM